MKTTHPHELPRTQAGAGPEKTEELMRTETLSTLTTVVLPRKKAHVSSANFSPVCGTAVRYLSKGDINRAEVLRQVLLGECPKVIAGEMGMSLGYVYRMLQDQGVKLMAVTAAERAALMAARKGAT